MKNTLAAKRFRRFFLPLICLAPFCGCTLPASSAYPTSAFIGHLRRLPVWQSGLHHLHERELPQRHPILYAHAKPAARHPGAGYGTERANIAPHTAQRSADATTANGRARQRKMPVIQFAEQ